MDPWHPRHAPGAGCSWRSEVTPTLRIRMRGEGGAQPAVGRVLSARWGCGQGPGPVTSHAEGLTGVSVEGAPV